MNILTVRNCCDALVMLVDQCEILTTLPKCEVGEGLQRFGQHVEHGQSQRSSCTTPLTKHIFL